MMTKKTSPFQLCTEDNLLPDYSTTFAPVSQLISSDRCRRIILVYSKDFLESPANNFYMNYAQAVGIGEYVFLVIGGHWIEWRAFFSPGLLTKARDFGHIVYFLSILSYCKISHISVTNFWPPFGYPLTPSVATTTRNVH